MLIPIEINTNGFRQRNIRESRGSCRSDRLLPLNLCQYGAPRHGAALPSIYVDDIDALPLMVGGWC